MDEESAVTTNGKRSYNRRSDQQRITDLESQIEEIRVREAQKRAARVKPKDPVLKEIPKVLRSVRKFAQFAMDHRRPDLANSATAFASMLERARLADSGH